MKTKESSNEQKPTRTIGGMPPTRTRPHKVPTMTKTTLTVNTSYKAKPLERVLAEMIHRGEDADTTMRPLSYQDRGNEVDAAFNIRTDRFDIALDAENAIERGEVAKREHMALLEKKKEEGTDATDVENNQ